MNKTLLEIHEDVPADHYDKGIKDNIFQKIWHSSRFLEIAKVTKQINGPILDVGCHSGTFTKKIADLTKSKEIYGIDISGDSIDAINKRIPFGHFTVADAQDKIPFKDELFDAVYCLEVLEHVDHPDKVLDEIYRCLKSGGTCLILVPSESKLFKIVWLLWTLVFPVWRHAHVQDFSGSRLERALIEHGFKIISIKKFNLGMLKLVVCQKNER